MDWEQRIIITYKEKNLEVIDFDGGWVFIKNTRNEIYPVRESVFVARKVEKNETESKRRFGP